MGNEREGRDRKGSKVLSLDDLESGGAIDRKMGVKRKRNGFDVQFEMIVRHPSRNV